MPEVWGTVSNSQVFNWIKLIDQMGISTDCISLSKNFVDLEKVDEIESKMGIKFQQFRPYFMIINDVFLSFLLLFKYFKYVFKYDKVVFQTRIPNVAIAFRFMAIFYKTEIIFEARGASVEERNYSNLKNKEKTSKLKYKIAQRYLELNEKWFINYSNKIICVSNTLRDYYINKYGLRSDEKFYVFHGAADADLFYFSQDLRLEYRKYLGVKPHQILVVYSGALKKKWEIPEVVLGFMKSFLDLDKRIIFLVMTPDMDIANEMARHFKITGRTIIMKSAFEDVNKFLNAADFGLLLRDDVMMNNVASPTKFSEYLNSGLPIIMSRGVTDYAKMIEESGFGIVLRDFHRLNQKDYQRFTDLQGLDRNRISKYGKELLSKEALLKRYYKMFFD